MGYENVTMENLYDKVHEYENFNYRPSCYCKYKIGTIFDEEKSVKWNREEVERRNIEIEKEAELLKNQKDLLYTEFISMVKSYITTEIGIGTKNAEKIWNYIYSNYHAYGLAECLNHLDELLELFL